MLEALKAAGLTGVWIPKEYGGPGGGVLDLCLVVEELSRACGGVGVAYAVNALGSFPILLGGTEEQKRRWLPGDRGGREADRLRPLREGRGLRRRQPPTRRAPRTATHYVLNGDKKWNTNGGVADALHGLRGHRPGSKGARGISAFIVEKGDPRLRDRQGRGQDGHPLRAGRRARTSRTAACRPTNLLGGEEGDGFKHAMMTLDRARPGVAAQAVGLAQGALELRGATTPRSGSSSASRSSPSRGSSGCSPTWRTQVEAARQLVYTAAHARSTPAPNVSKIVGDVQALRDRHRDEGHDRRGADLRRLRLHARTTRSRSTCATPRSRRSTRGRTRSSAS